MEFIFEFWHVILASGVVGTVLTGVLFNILPQAAIDFLFFKRKENYRAQLDQELETHKKNLSEELEKHIIEKNHEFDMLLNRKIIWHEKEMEVLAEAWKKLNVVDKNLSEIFPFLSYMKDLERMSEEKLDKFLTDQELSDDDKEYVKKGNPSKSEAYKNIQEKELLKKAFDSFNDFLFYLTYNIIFIKPSIKEKFIEARNIIRGLAFEKGQALDERLEKGFFERDFYKDFNEKEKQISTILEDLQDIIRKELFPEERSKLGTKKRKVKKPSE